MKSIRITSEAAADFVRLAKAKPYKSTSELIAAFRSWVKENHGPKAETHGGQIYPPGTVSEKPFRGSIRWEGDTTAEKRTIKSGGLKAFMDAHTKLPCGHESVSDYCGTCSMSMVEDAQAQLDAIKKRKERAA
jgi:hypothetical protein